MHIKSTFLVKTSLYKLSEKNLVRYRPIVDKII
jgi:hypothetical protein